jgi:hypothetical protein
MASLVPHVFPVALQAMHDLVPDVRFNSYKSESDHVGNIAQANLQQALRQA